MEAQIQKTNKTFHALAYSAYFHCLRCSVGHVFVPDLWHHHLLLLSWLIQLVLCQKQERMLQKQNWFTHRFHFPSCWLTCSHYTIKSMCTQLHVRKWLCTDTMYACIYVCMHVWVCVLACVWSLKGVAHLPSCRVSFEASTDFTDFLVR